MKLYNKEQAINKMNYWGSNNEPFLFVIDFNFEKILLFKQNEVPKNILVSLPSFNNSSPISLNKKIQFDIYPENFKSYSNKFNFVKEQLNYGNSYLTNLCCVTPIDSNLNLSEIFHISEAKYRLCVENEFVVFSPECFVNIVGNKIFTFPMKGTIDSSIPNAPQILLNDKKEIAEHATIVDLLRNDLSRVAKNVNVDRFMQLDTINSGENELIQASSTISGNLSKDFNNQLGTLFFKLLPAGSITGAPKAKTIEIIKTIECFDRNYYTGVFGFYDGENLESAVMIRYIEHDDNNLYYKSGGGITFQSDAFNEYKEMINKIYVPISGNYKSRQRRNTTYQVA